jgi:hypothetical protein
MPKAEWWLRHENRRWYDRVEFLPGEDAPDDVLNLWRGRLVEPADGHCELFLDFVRDVIADGNPAVSEFLINWLAHLFQRPAEHPEVAVALRGGQGTGKSFFVKHRGELVGRHFFPVSDPRHLYGNFNAPLQQALLVFADEAFAPEDKKSHGILKALVTEEHITIEQKGVDAFKARKFFRLILASNNSWVVPAEVDDRRFLMLDVSNARQRDYGYFTALEAEWRGGGREAFLAHLLARDLSAFNHRARPKTAALEDQKFASLRGPRRKVYDWLMSGDVPAVKTDTEGRVFVITMDLAEKERCTAKALGLELARASHHKESVRETVDGRQYRGFWLPALTEARRLWAAAMGLEPVWPKDDGIWGACATPEDPF